MFASVRLPIDHGGPVDRPFQPFSPSALNGSISVRFDEMARRFSGRLAVSDTQHQFTYAELAVLVDRIAGATASAVAGRPGPVAILLSGDAYFPAAVLGVLAAGCGYVPLDARSPISRNRLIAAHAGVVAVVLAGVADIQPIFPQALPIVDLDALGDAPREGCSTVGPDHLACIIYTSGSTGIPKGVYQNHRNLLHAVTQLTDGMHVNEEDRVISPTSVSFVGATRDVLFTLLNGASLHMIPASEFSPALFVDQIRSRAITICRLPPSLLRRIADVLEPHRRLDSVRLVHLVSDRMNWSDVDLFQRCFAADAHLMVSMGSTESPRTRWFVDPAMRATAPCLPVGRTLPDHTVTIVDEDQFPVADGTVGEFVVAGRHVALGYWRDPEATARAFAVDPADPEVRIFKTGDLGLRRPDGLFEAIGRKDRQLKLNGQRIEPAEIESVLRNCAGVADAVVVVRESEAGVLRSLVAYVETCPGMSKLSPRDILARLAQDLPIYMVPASVEFIGKLPRLANLKIDRQRLARIDSIRMSRSFDRVDDPLIDEVAEIFQSVIGVDRATPMDNVKSLGGDSLQAVKIAVELEQRFGVEIPPRVFESTQTVGTLAAWISDQMARLPRATVPTGPVRTL